MLHLRFPSLRMSILLGRFVDTKELFDPFENDRARCWFPHVHRIWDETAPAGQKTHPYNKCVTKGHTAPPSRRHGAEVSLSLRWERSRRSYPAPLISFPRQAPGEI